MFYDYLLETFGEGEPILISDIKYKDLNTNAIRQQIKRLCDKGDIERYDSGIYYIPKMTIYFKTGIRPSLEKVIEKKYLKENGENIGYISGVAFANDLHLTTQVAMNYEVVTNKATNDFRRVKLARATVILKKPKTTINNDNYLILQFLDLIRDIDYLAEVDRKEVIEIITSYMQKTGIEFKDCIDYLRYYPDKIFKNMYYSGVLESVKFPTQ